MVLEAASWVVMIVSMLFGGRGYGGQGWGGGGFSFGDFVIILIIIGIIYFVIKRYKAKRAMVMSGTDGGGYGSYAYNESAYNSSPYGSSTLEDTVVVGLRHISEMVPTFSENTFKETAEDIFFKIQGAWSKRDLSGVRDLLTAQMLNTFQTETNNFIVSKQSNRLENMAVHQAEIVDAVQDRGEEYITIRFLASLLNYTVDEVTGNVIYGNPTDPVKFLEYWSFTRKVGEKNWALAGITQEQDYH
jgi:predicted lipid-binding transport protein (Tim44 family)